MLEFITAAQAQGMHDGQMATGMLTGLVPLIIVSIPFAIGFFFVADRLGRNKWAWAIVSLVPLVNYFFWVYAFFVIVLEVLDRLGTIQAALTPNRRGRPGDDP